MLKEYIHLPILLNRYLQVLSKLSDEVETLRCDRHDVEQHLLRMEAWSENLSNWRAHIQSVNHIQEEEFLQVR